MIRPHTSLVGPQLAGWTPRCASEPRYGLTCEGDIPIRLPDGTVLRGDLYRPRAAGSFPTLIAWSNYTKELHTAGVPMPFNEIGVVGYFVRRGYCHLTISARGSGKSEGAYSMFFSPAEQQDVADAIGVVAAQPWCDGNIGMIGMSYFGVIQYLAAARRPPALKAIFPYLAFTDLFNHALSRGGAAHNGFLAAYFAFHGSSQWLDVPPTIRNLLGYVLDRGWTRWIFPRMFPRAVPHLPKILRPREPYLRTLVSLLFDERQDGPRYWAHSPSPVLQDIEVPVCIGSNWGNVAIHLRGAFEAWHRLKAPKKLFIGAPEAVWPWKSYQEEALAWYDAQLKGLPTGYDNLPPVRYWLQGAEVWRDATDWPVPDAAPRRFYLSADGASGPESVQRLSTDAPPTPASSASFLAVPRGVVYPRVMNRYEPQRLRYVTPPLDEDLEVVGPITLQVMLSSTALDTYLITRLGDLAPNGALRKLAFGWLLASNRAIDAQRSTPSEIIHDFTRLEPLALNQPTLLRFSLNPTAHLFRRGHAIVLDVCSRPDLVAPRWTEGFVFFDWEAPPYPARNTIHHGLSEPSYLEVCVRPR